MTLLRFFLEPAGDGPPPRGGGGMDTGGEGTRVYRNKKLHNVHDTQTGPLTQRTLCPRWLSALLQANESIQQDNLTQKCRRKICAKVK